VASNYRKRVADRGIADGECGAVTVIQRANSDLGFSGPQIIRDSTRLGSSNNLPLVMLTPAD
jgi:hypothetical protein